MKYFEFIIDQKNVFWDRVYVEVEAETQEEALEKCKSGEYEITDYGDTEYTNTLHEVIMDEHNNILWEG